MPSMVRAGRLALGFLAAFLAAGCPSAPSGVEDDGGLSRDAGRPDAANPNQSALVFVWNVPVGMVNDHLTIDEIRLPLRDVRAIGDAAPGDNRTYVAALDLRFRPGDPPPPPVSFPQAPPGLYSRFEFRVQSSDGNGWQISGTIKLSSGQAVTYSIHDRFMLPISLPLSGVTLQVGKVQTVEIGAAINAVLSAIPWDSIEVDDGKIELSEDSPEMVLLLPALAAAFSAHAVP